MNETRICPKCGTLYNADIKFCPSDGTKVIKINKETKERYEFFARNGNVPFGYFRCDTCGKAQPCRYIAGALMRWHERKAYTVCTFCQFRFGLTKFESGFLGHGVDKNGHGYVDWEKIDSIMQRK